MKGGCFILFRNVSTPEQEMLLLTISPRHYRFADTLIENDDDATRLIELLQTKVELAALFTLRKSKLTEQTITFEQFEAAWQQSPLTALRHLLLYPLTNKDMPILLKSMIHTGTTLKDF